MAKVLLLTSSKQGGLQASAELSFLQQFAQRLKNAPFEFFFSSLDQLNFSITANEPFIQDVYNKLDIAEYDIVYFRNVHLQPDYFKAVSLYLSRVNRRFIEDQDVAGTAFGKISQMFLFSINGVAVPDTLSILDRDRFTSAVIQRNSWPIVLKANDGIKGRNNFLIKDSNNFKEVLSSVNKPFLAQEFIPNDGDYRVLFVGARAEPVIFKRVATAGTHLNNTSQGGEAQELDGSTFNEEALKMSRKIVAITGREVSGIDLLQSSATGNWVALEVNTTPALSTGALLDVKTRAFQKFIESKLQGDGS